MAEANAVDDVTVIMPHLVYGASEMDKLYPPFTAPPELDAEDPLKDLPELLLEEGLLRVKDILKATSTQGRRRRLVEEHEDVGTPLA